MNYQKKNQTKSFKFGWLLIIFIVAFFMLKNAFGSVELNKTVVIVSGDSFSKFLGDLPKLKQIGLKFRVKSSNSILDISKIEEGSYVFSGSYSQNDFLKVISQGPKSIYQKYTVLEGRSVYDIDDDLTKKGFISQGEYIDFVSNSTYISKYQNRYEFLSKAGNLAILEGFLYPDTYFLDMEGNIIDQLVYLQLDNFNNKVWKKYESQISAFKKLDWYETVILASIIEKEEKNDANKSTVAGIFVNRLDKKMLLGADITLCYGLKKPYAECTPNVIVKNLNDSSNVYNTRANSGLTPQPIANPSQETILAVLNYKNTDYLYYLHDNNGVIRYGKTLQEHNVNKQKYLK